MRKRSKKFTAILVLVSCVALVYGIKAVIGPSAKGESTQTGRKVKGDKNAPVKITEFVDFQCPACAQGSKYLKGEIQRHPELIRLRVKYFPLKMHRYGLLSAQYAECAAQQGKFWAFHDLLFSRQGNWRRLASAQPAFQQIASDVQLDMDDLKECLSDVKVTKIIAKNKMEGTTRGVRSTPSYFINGKMVVGKKSLELEIKKYLEKN